MVLQKITQLLVQCTILSLKDEQESVVFECEDVSQLSMFTHVRP